MKNEEMALLFSEATPYIQKYHGKTMVIKYGGNAMINETLKNAVMNDLVTLTLLGVRVVLVHGGGPAINEMLKKVGVESHFAGGLRVTDDATMEIVQQVLAGKVNKDLVAKLRGRGVGLCGMDGQMLRCTELDPQLGHVGEIVHVDPTLISSLLDSGYIPVIATVGMDDLGQAYNVNADTAAAQIAIALKTLELIALRGGAPRREDLIPHHVLDGADQPHPGPQHGLQHILDEKGGGGLAVGPGHPHQGQPLRRPAEPVGRQKSQGPPWIRGHQPGPILLRALPAEDGGRPPVQGLPDVPGAVVPGPGQGREQGPGLQRPGVIGYGIYFHIKFRSLPREGDAVQKFPQLHHDHPSRVSFILSKLCCAGG